MCEHRFPDGPAAARYMRRLDYWHEHRDDPLWEKRFEAEERKLWAIEKIRPLIEGSEKSPSVAPKPHRTGI
jgi:hypothetical protein